MARLTNLIIASACLAAVTPAAAEKLPLPLHGSGQCVLVLTKDWKAHTGILYSFERKDEFQPWQQRGKGIPVVVGRSGLGWGRGMTDVSKLSGPMKHEGDGRAPAGVFTLRTAFGYVPEKDAHAAYHVELPYIMLTDLIEGVDDPHSRYYNQIVNRSRIAHVDWKSAEHMHRPDGLYRWGAVIEHNTAPPVPGAGSCVFLHIWQNHQDGTAGCTAMAEPNLTALLAWLTPRNHPKLVQLTRQSFSILAEDWKLPQPSDAPAR